MRLAAARHVLAIAALPFVVTIVVPVWIGRAYGSPLAVGRMTSFSMLAGGAIMLAGLMLFAWSLGMFATKGDGTLAPWDPPRTLVVAGPYRYVRNPMISGVVIVLFGEAVLWRSMLHLEWAATFLALNVVMIPLIEEPMLRARFGEPYDDYRRHVPGLIPRLTPWKPRTS